MGGSWERPVGRELRQTGWKGVERDRMGGRWKGLGWEGDRIGLGDGGHGEMGRERERDFFWSIGTMITPLVFHIFLRMIQHEICKTIGGFLFFYTLIVWACGVSSISESAVGWSLPSLSSSGVSLVGSLPPFNSSYLTLLNPLVSFPWILAWRPFSSGHFNVWKLSPPSHCVKIIITYKHMSIEENIFKLKFGQNLSESQ